MTRILFVLLLASVISNCTDPIDITPDEAPPLLTVDAWLDDQSRTQDIILSWSQNYFNATEQPPVTGAIVEVQDDLGNSFEFTEVSSGKYSWTPQGFALKIGEPGTQFTLTIDLDGQMYSATSTMMPSPAIDEIRQEFRDDEVGREDGIWTEFIARDLPGLGNTYWIKTFKNDDFLNRPEEINIAFDAAFDAGAQIDGLIFIPPIRELTNPMADPDDNTDTDPAPWAAGDKIRVEIHSINVDAFLFMELMRDQILNGNNGIFASPLANTKGNVTMQNGDDPVLGVFNVASIAMREQIIE